MNMSKNQIVMASIGAAALVASAVLGYMAFDAYSTKGEAEEELEGSSSTVQRLLRAEVSPVKESEIEYKKNADTLAGWSEAALATAAVGDRAIKADVNPAAFKQQLVDEARALSELEGGVDGRIVKSGFTFGFPDFVTGDKLPERERLPQYQRLWGDVRYIVEKLQGCGVTEVVSIAPAGAPQQATAQQQEEKPRRKGAAKRDAEEEKPAYTVEKYDVQFRAKPAALVKSVNMFSTCDRFIVVDAMSFAREADMIGAALGEGDKNAQADGAQPRGRGRGRGRGRRAQEQEQEQEKQDGEAEGKKGIVNDPAQEAPFLVKMTVSTYDFGSAAKADAQGGADDGEAAPEQTSKEEER